jgi:hypothetical protein
LAEIKRHVQWCKETLVGMTKDEEPDLAKSAELRERSFRMMCQAVDLAQTTHQNCQTLLTLIDMHSGSQRQQPPPVGRSTPTLDGSIRRTLKQLHQTYRETSTSDSSADDNLKKTLKILALVSVLRTLVAAKLRESAIRPRAAAPVANRVVVQASSDKVSQ